jgi:hypothetical protein
MLKGETMAEQTLVVFRKWKNGDIIALFPENTWRVGSGMECMSYEHVGWFGGANYDGVIRQTKLATPGEYTKLQTELESIGYALKIRTRRLVSHS